MNIPNLLTTIRFLLVPVFIYTFYSNKANHIVPLIIFLVAGVTDFLDGYIARRFNMITKWGKLLDPLADKAMQLSALFVLTHTKLLPLWVIIVVLAKEVFMVVGSLTLYRKEIVVQANWYGKLATVLFYFAVVIIIFVEGPIGRYAMVASVIATLYAALRYTVHYTNVSAGEQTDQQC